MEPTHFAPAERATPDGLKKDIKVIVQNPVIDELMRVTGGLLAVLNEQRQILAMNEFFLELLQIDNAESAFGLRVGEAIKCAYADKTEGGCGTTEYCSTCGVAIAIVSSLGSKKSVERTCAVTTTKNGKMADLFFRVRCCPIQFDDESFLLLFLQDISKEQEWANLEKVFYHDINNIIFGLIGRSELLAYGDEKKYTEYSSEIFQLSRRLQKELEIQKSLSISEFRAYRPVFQQVSVKNVLDEINNIFKDHKASKNKTLVFPEKLPELNITTDLSLLVRILSNMVVNAFEASVDGEKIKLLFDHGEKKITFSVWSRLSIQENISKRIFQRNFSTKNGLGRGLGTYSMKYFGEEILNGKLDFSTSEEEGTVFSVSLNISESLI